MQAQVLSLCPQGPGPCRVGGGSSAWFTGPAAPEPVPEPSPASVSSQSQDWLPPCSPCRGSSCCCGIWDGRPGLGSLARGRWRDVDRAPGLAFFSHTLYFPLEKSSPNQALLFHKKVTLPVPLRPLSAELEILNSSWRSSPPHFFFWT